MICIPGLTETVRHGVQPHEPYSATHTVGHGPDIRINLKSTKRRIWYAHVGYRTAIRAYLGHKRVRASTGLVSKLGGRI